MRKLTTCPVTLAQANDFVAEHHRHHKPVRGHKFSIGCLQAGRLVGVAIVGRPVSRYLDNGLTLEITRLCTDGTYNACSMLYAAAWRAARAMGYRRMVTYTLDTEDGASLRAAGWTLTANTRGGSWDCPSRRRQTNAPICPKHRWEVSVDA